MYLFSYVMFKVYTFFYVLFGAVSKTVQALTKPAAIVCLGLAMYQLYSNNFFSALILVFLSNMILVESRYREIKARLDAQEYL